MSFIGSIIKAGAAVGAAYALLKVNDKYKAQNPEGVADENKVEAIKKAAADVYSEATEIIKEKGPDAIGKVSAKMNDVYKQAVDTVNEKAPGVADKVQSVIESVSEKMPEVTARIQTVAEDISVKVSEVIDNVAEKIAQTEEEIQVEVIPEDDFDEVVDSVEAEQTEEEKTPEE